MVQPKSPKPKKSATLTMRLTQQTRDALEAAAAKEGRSISEMAERWLDLAARGEADLQGRLGGGALTETMITAAAFSRALCDDVAATHPEFAQTDPTEDIGLRAALVGGLGRLFALTYPIRGHGGSTPNPQPFRDALRQACERCKHELSRASSRAGGTQDHDAFVALDRCASGDMTADALDGLGEPLSRLLKWDDIAVCECASETQLARSSYLQVLGNEMAALVEWTRRGRLIADQLAGTELLSRVHRAVMMAQRMMPNSAFATGGSLAVGVASTNVLVERETGIERIGREHPLT